MTNPRRWLHAAASALFACTAIAASAQDAKAPDMLELVRGTWKIFGPDGKVAQDCDKGQHFEPSSDRRHIELTEPWATPPFSANYLVVHSENGRILTYIENEDRLTDQHDPVLWWFTFKDADHFRFRRYDWAEDNYTNGEWERCPAGAR